MNLLNHFYALISSKSFQLSHNWAEISITELKNYLVKNYGNKINYKLQAFHSKLTKEDIEDAKSEIKILGIDIKHGTNIQRSELT